VRQGPQRGRRLVGERRAERKRAGGKQAEASEQQAKQPEQEHEGDRAAGPRERAGTPTRGIEQDRRPAVRRPTAKIDYLSHRTNNGLGAVKSGTS